MNTIPAIRPHVEIIDNHARTNSLKIAEHFGKLHKNVMRDIENLECSEQFNRLNFEPITYLDSRNREQRMYEITRDGFTFLVMGFTGTEAARWKEAYIEAFNRMERTIRQRLSGSMFERIDWALLERLDAMGPRYVRAYLGELGLTREELKRLGQNTPTPRRFGEVRAVLQDPAARLAAENAMVSDALLCWLERFADPHHPHQTPPLTVGAALQSLAEADGPGVLPALARLLPLGVNSYRLGRLFAAIEGRDFGGLSVRAAGRSHRALVWIVARGEVGHG